MTTQDVIFLLHFLATSPNRLLPSAISKTLYCHVGVDQNKRAWERYNRRSTANQSRTHRWQSRRDFVLSNVICTGNEIDISIYTEIYRSHNLEEIGKRHGMAMGQWLHLGVPQSPHNRGSIAAQSRIRRSKTWKLGLQKDWHCKCCVCLGK